MTEYIKRRDALKVLEEMESIEDGFARMYEIPAADVVEVVRCKECKYRVNGWSDGKPCCANLDGGMSADVELKDDDFCSYGERRHENASDSK